MRRLVVAVCIAIMAVAAGPSEPWATATVATIAQVNELVAASVKIHDLTRTQISALPAASMQRADVVYPMYYGCVTATQCVFGDTLSATSIVLFGDSHARMWLPALAPLATADRLKVIVLGYDGCPVILRPLPGSKASCETETKAAIKVIDTIRPRAVIVSDRTTWLKSITGPEWRVGFTATLAALAVSGAHLAVIGDIQIFNEAVISCLAQHTTSVQTCSVGLPNSRQPSHASAESAAAAALKVKYANPVPWLCTATACSPVIGPYIAYWDAFHVSVPYAKYLSGVLGTAFARTLKP